jgi:hypothetical protein
LTSRFGYGSGAVAAPRDETAADERPDCRQPTTRRPSCSVVAVSATARPPATSAPATNAVATSFGYSAGTRRRSSPACEGRGPTPGCRRSRPGIIGTPRPAAARATSRSPAGARCRGCRRLARPALPLAGKPGTGTGDARAARGLRKHPSVDSRLEEVGSMNTDGKTLENGGSSGSISVARFLFDLCVRRRGRERRVS